MHGHFEQGTNNSLCHTCGRVYKANQLREQWDGIIACPRCYDSKHPDLEPRIAPKEDPRPDLASPRPSFENLTFVDVPGLSEWDGVMCNGQDYGTEWTWDEMNITWDEAFADQIEDLELR
jgi:hypothetical protein